MSYCDNNELKVTTEKEKRNLISSTTSVGFGAWRVPIVVTQEANAQHTGGPHCLVKKSRKIGDTNHLPKKRLRCIAFVPSLIEFFVASLKKYVFSFPYLVFCLFFKKTNIFQEGSGLKFGFAIFSFSHFLKHRK